MPHLVQKGLLSHGIEFSQHDGHQNLGLLDQTISSHEGHLGGARKSINFSPIHLNKFVTLKIIFHEKFLFDILTALI